MVIIRWFSFQLLLLSPLVKVAHLKRMWRLMILAGAFISKNIEVKFLASLFSHLHFVNPHKRQIQNSITSPTVFAKAKTWYIHGGKSFRAIWLFCLLFTSCLSFVLPPLTKEWVLVFIRDEDFVRIGNKARKWFPLWSCFPGLISGNRESALKMWSGVRLSNFGDPKHAIRLKWNFFGGEEIPLNMPLLSLHASAERSSWDASSYTWIGLRKALDKATISGPPEIKIMLHEQHCSRM